MPKITLENGVVVDITIESYRALEKAAKKDWRDAVEEFKYNFAKRTSAKLSYPLCSREYPFHARMIMLNNAIRSLRDKAIIMYCLSAGGSVTFETNKKQICFRPDPAIADYQKAKEGIQGIYENLLSNASQEELKRNKIISKSIRGGVL